MSELQHAEDKRELLHVKFRSAEGQRAKKDEDKNWSEALSMLHETLNRPCILHSFCGLLKEMSPCRENPPWNMCEIGLQHVDFW